LDGGLPPADKFDLPADHRDILRIEFEGETWGNSWVEILRVGDMHSIKCQPAQLNPIQVPAGIFKNCIESVEIFSGEFGDKKEEWETHIFWAPNVGRVYEYQILPDGTITYELKLLQYESN